jgi:histidinol phosphatase-like enzyme
MKNKKDKQIEQEIIRDKHILNSKLLRDYIVVLKKAYAVYDEAEDMEVKLQITEVIRKCGIYLTDASAKVKKALLDRIKLYLHNIRSFDRDIILEEGATLLESI